MYLNSDETKKFAYYINLTKFSIDNQRIRSLQPKMVSLHTIWLNRTNILFNQTLVNVAKDLGLLKKMFWYVSEFPWDQKIRFLWAWQIYNRLNQRIRPLQPKMVSLDTIWLNRKNILFNQNLVDAAKDLGLLKKMFWHVSEFLWDQKICLLWAWQIYNRLKQRIFFLQPKMVSLDTIYRWIISKTQSFRKSFNQYIEQCKWK